MFSFHSTLYPAANITLLPSPSVSHRFGLASYQFNDGDYSEQEVISHMKDAFKANREYINSDIMYFDFRNPCVSEKHYVDCLEKTVEYEELSLPKEIITWNIRT